MRAGEKLSKKETAKKLEETQLQLKKQKRKVHMASKDIDAIADSEMVHGDAHMKLHDLATELRLLVGYDY